MADELDDDTVAAVRRILATGGRPQLCPGCGRRELDDDQDLCHTCRAEAERAKKRDWWRRQGDYRSLLAAGHDPAGAAEKWLAHRLRKGPVPSREVRNDAARAGISRKRLRGARERLQAAGRLVVDRAPNVRGRPSTWRLTSTRERAPEARNR